MLISIVKLVAFTKTSLLIVVSGSIKCNKQNIKIGGLKCKQKYVKVNLLNVIIPILPSLIFISNLFHIPILVQKSHLFLRQG